MTKLELLRKELTKSEEVISKLKSGELKHDPEITELLTEGSEHVRSELLRLIKEEESK